MHLLESPQTKNILSSIRYTLTDLLHSKILAQDVETILKKIPVTIEKHINRKELLIPRPVYLKLFDIFKHDLRKVGYDVSYKTIHVYLEFVNNIINHSI